VMGNRGTYLDVVFDKNQRNRSLRKPAL
jgi:hypothetical protein